MKLIAAASLLTAATAFAPLSQKVGQRSVQLNLWGEPTEKDEERGDRSVSLPFAPRPKLLDGTLAGDVGFE